MPRATFDDFKPQVYEFEVEAPDGSMLEFEMRALTPAQLLAIDLAHPRPQPRVYDFHAPKGKGEKPEPRYSSDEDAPPEVRAEWTRAVNEWLQDHRNRQILAALQMDIPGETDEERIEAMASLGAWAISAFSRAVQLVIATSEAALKGRSFQRD